MATVRPGARLVIRARRGLCGGTRRPRGCRTLTPARVRAVSILAATLPILACAAEPAQAPVRIVIDVSERKLYEYIGGELTNTYAVAVGTRKYPTPTGRFRIYQVDWNPTWHPPDSDWAKGEAPKGPGEPGNPMGRVKMIFKPPYTIHGTTAVESLGKAASHGSIRLSNRNAMNLARRLMEHGGAHRSDAWYTEVIRSPRDLRQVRIPNPIPLQIRP